MASTQSESADAEAIRANKLALVERLADDLAHEIKNPLHSMVINLEVLRRRIGRLAEAEQADLLRYAGVLGGELDCVTRRIDLLLRLVRPQRGGELTTLGQTVEELLELLELERERHGVSIALEPPREPMRGHLRRDDAWQLALNLLMEALDSVPPGGTLNVRVERQPDRAVLRLEGSPGRPAASGNGGGADPSRIAVVRALAQSLGGELEIPADPADPGDGHAAYTLSIPTLAP